MELESIVIATGSDPSYSVFSGSELFWTEYNAQNKMELIAYLNGMLTAAGIRDFETIKKLIQNGPKENSQWFYAGEPLNGTEFNEIVESLNSDHDTYA